MAHFANTTRLWNTDVDEVFADIDVLCDAENSLPDLPVDARECDDFSVWLDLPEGDSAVADIHSEIDEYRERRSVTDNTHLSTRLNFEHRAASYSDGSRRNMSKNAVLARENREKKKRYICGLEKTVHDLSMKNKKLVHGCAAMRGTIADLRREANYLRGVIENQSELARLLKHVPIADRKGKLPASANVSNDERDRENELSYIKEPLCGSSLHSSEFIHNDLMPVADHDSLLMEHDYARSQNARSERQHECYNSSRRQFGVCLHVVNQATSLQFCAICNENAY